MIEISRETLLAGYLDQALEIRVWKALALPLLMQAIQDDAPILRRLEGRLTTLPGEAAAANDELPVTAVFADAVRARIAEARIWLEGRGEAHPPPSAA